MSDLISIIVPVYKVEEYLEDCIKSIMNQTYKNLEIILVNDGSPDNCGKICDQYSQIDKRIKVIHKANGGQSSARNLGLDIAKGDYIGFVDSDDLINSQMYEVLVKSAKEHDSDIAECRFEKIYERKINFKEQEYEYSKSFSNIEAIENHLNGNYFYRCVWNKIYKRYLFNDIRFPIGKVGEELYIWHEIFYKAQNISYNDFVGYYYYIREDSTMGNRDLKLINGTVEGFKIQHEFISQKIPKLKKNIDTLYINNLLKSYVYLNKLKNEKNINLCKNIIAEELKRNDIKPMNLSKIALNMYKISPKVFSFIFECFYKEVR